MREAGETCWDGGDTGASMSKNKNSILMTVKPPRLVLASASTSRAALLRAAGLDFATRPASVDETTLRESMRAEGASAGDAALALAEFKASNVSRIEAGSLVIGADQILNGDGEWYEKPANLERARNQLIRLRGRAHRLATAVCVMRDGERLWTRGEAPRLVMREFSDQFLDAYLAAVGESVLSSVGGYQLEGPGAQLFSSIEGDYFAILGLPLVALLDFLRGQGALTP